MNSVWRRVIRGLESIVWASATALGVVATAGLICVEAHAAPPIVSLSARAMGTNWSVKFLQPNPHIPAVRIQELVVERLEQLEQQFSTYRPEAELSRFNEIAHTDWVPASPELVRIAHESRQISELTGGAFDVTVEPLIRLWGFKTMRRPDAEPTAQQLAKVRELVGWRQFEVRLETPALRKAKPGINVDLSSMAKGFAADAVSEMLSKLGVTNHLVAIGGDLKSSGLDNYGDGWKTAVEQPYEMFPAIAGVVALNGQALSTSGNYANYVYYGLRRYGHILDPRTGKSPTHSLGSVSVIHSSCATSSALATALFVLGPVEGFRFATEQSLACFFVIREGDTWIKRATPEFERFMQKDKEP